jgi:chromosome partitioning protein
MASNPRQLSNRGHVSMAVPPGQPGNCGLQIVPCQVGQHCATVELMLVAFTNTKGGVGKSTLASHLAIWLFDRGYRVALLDADEQKTAARWVEAAEPALTIATASDMDAIQEARIRLCASHDIVVADTPGKESDAARTVTLLCDLAIVPLQPSKPDLRAIKDALKHIRLAQEISGSRRPEAHLVLNLTAKLDVQTKALRKQLEAAGFPVARRMVRRLNALRDACDTAVTRMKPSEGAEAAKDIDALFTEVLGHRLDNIEQFARGSVEQAANE